MLWELRLLSLWLPSHLMCTTPHLSQGCGVHVSQGSLSSPILLVAALRELCQVWHGLGSQPLEATAEVLVM